MKIEIRAPATTANLGPGFDFLGAAVGCALEVSADTNAGRWDVSGREPLKGEELVLEAAALIADVPRLGGSILHGIPIGRGLGSSAAAISAGLLLGCALVGREPDARELLELGLPLEGHPDNLAACLYGGLVLVLPDRQVVRFAPSGGVRPTVLVPHERLSTKKARGVLPNKVPLRDAVATAARASGLLALMTGTIEATAERLLACTEDVLHQPYRAKLMPATASALKSLRERGVPAVVSGAGPSILCLLVGDVTVEAPDGWEVLEPGWDTRGARFVITG